MLKRDQTLVNYLVSGRLLGQVLAHLRVVEIQKRWLPHAHILIILANHDSMVTTDLAASLVMAELPPDPNDARTEPEKVGLQRLKNIVLGNMTHGPSDI